MQKRERGKNYTENEKYTLLSIAEKYLSSIENKKTDDGTREKKSRAWQRISVEYNANQQTGLRSPLQLKALYENIGQKAKKDKAEQKVRFVIS